MRTCWVDGYWGGRQDSRLEILQLSEYLCQSIYEIRVNLLGGARLMAEVIIFADESFERALRRFKKKCEKAGILSDLRKHRHYEKPSERRKRKLNAARRKRRRPTR